MAPEWAHAAERIKICDLYKTQTEFSERALALANSEVEVPGFMAPPLKADATFFVLTKMPMAVCPSAMTRRTGRRTSFSSV